MFILISITVYMALFLSSNWMKITENMISNSENAFGNNICGKDYYLSFFVCIKPNTTAA